MNVLQGIAANPAQVFKLPEPSSTPGGSFSDAIGAAMTEVENTQTLARKAANDFMVNGAGDVHTVALATQKAELSLEMFQQVRNKFVQAYQEIMKMPM
jgi:flagellar hook-basal body complex protein FliE